ncbi:MAG: tetratricopeptide repeat protein [Alkalibacterium sp.]|uniref:tetratricopeptide repeat protein n=1 Tax=Alkalibacterium sp. TaxID=1872447 RepID=UPI003970F11F
MPYTPQGYGDDVARVFCPHCGAIVVQWHITSERDYDEWVWFGKNATINQERPLPPSFLLHWGLDIPLHLLPDYHEKGLDIEKIQQYHIEEKAQRQKILEKEKKSKEKDDIDWSKVSDFYDFASTLKSKGDFKGAEKAYRLAIEEKTLSSVAAHNGLGQLLERQERYDEAIEIYKKATVDYPDNGIAFKNLAFLLINLDKLKEAEAIYEKAMKIAPGHPITNYIKSELEEKKADEAKRTGAKPVTSFPYFNSLAISPNNENIGWISWWEANRFSVSILSPIGESPHLELEYTTSRKPPVYTSIMSHVLFVAGGRLLVAIPLEASLARLVLLDVESGKELSSEVVPEFKYYTLCANNTGETIAAQKDSESLLVVYIADDKLTYRLVRTGQTYGPTPYFAPNGKLYAVHYQTFFSIEGDKAVPVTNTNEANSVAFDSAGKVYFGGGFSDRSGEASLQIVDLDSCASSEMPWSRDPIDVIEPVGDDKLLLGNMVAESTAFQYPKSNVSLFRITDRKKEWNIEFSDLPSYHSPVLLSVPENGWTLLQSGRLLKRVSLDNGEVLEEFPKEKNEFVQARWLASKRMLCVSRNRSKSAGGTLELYKIE